MRKKTEILALLMRVCKEMDKKLYLSRHSLESVRIGECGEFGREEWYPYCEVVHKISKGVWILDFDRQDGGYQIQEVDDQDGSLNRMIFPVRYRAEEFYHGMRFSLCLLRLKKRTSCT